jgi:hypothetical protein
MLRMLYEINLIYLPHSYYINAFVFSIILPILFFVAVRFASPRRFFAPSKSEFLFAICTVLILIGYLVMKHAKQFPYYNSYKDGNYETIHIVKDDLGKNRFSDVYILDFERVPINKSRSDLSTTDFDHYLVYENLFNDCTELKAGLVDDQVVFLKCEKPLHP